MSRSKKNWDHLVNYEGNYDFGATIQKGERGPAGVRGPKGLPGPQGIRGPKGEVGQAANLWLWKGNVSAISDLPPAMPGTNGHVYLVDETSYFYVSNGDFSYYMITSFEHVKGNKGDAGVELPPDDSVYGRQTIEVDGEEIGNWARVVSLDGDNMQGPLTVPNLGVGPGELNIPTITMQGEFTHVLEAREEDDLSVMWEAWTIPNLGLTQAVRPDEIAFGNNIFLAGGQNLKDQIPVVGDKHLLLSTDGQEWTGLNGPESDLYRWAAIKYGGGRFLLAGVNSIGSTIWYQTFNGYDFTELIAMNQPTEVQGLEYGSGRWVCTTRVKNTPIWFSDDNGASWQLPQDASSLITPGGRTFTEMASDGNGHWIALDSRTNKMTFSLDNGLNWGIKDFDLYLTSGSKSVVSGIAYGKGTWVVTVDLSGSDVGENSKFIYYSYDGVQWTGAIVPVIRGVSDVHCNDSLFVACSVLDDEPFLVSVDGIEWTGYDQPKVKRSGGGWRRVIFGLDTWILASGGNAPSVCIAYLKVDSDLTASGLYYDGALVATESNLEPVFDRIRENTQAIQGLVSEAIGVLSGDTLPVSDASGDPHPEGTLFFYTRTSSLYIRHEGIWLKLTN